MGSEMCIRDSAGGASGPHAGPHRARLTSSAPGPASYGAQATCGAVARSRPARVIPIPSFRLRGADSTSWVGARTHGARVIPDVVPRGVRTGGAAATRGPSRGSHDALVDDARSRGGPRDLLRTALESRAIDGPEEPVSYTHLRAHETLS